jgi:hypothetical protein
MFDTPSHQAISFHPSLRLSTHLRAVISDGRVATHFDIMGEPFLCRAGTLTKRHGFQQAHVPESII